MKSVPPPATRLITPKIPPPRVWRVEENKLLGQFPDAEVGRRLGCSTGSVTHQRKKLKVRAFRSMPKWKPWTPAEEKLLGTLPDPVVAKKLGRTLNAIRARREHAGLPPITRYVFWDAKKLALVGKLRDE